MKNEEKICPVFSDSEVKQPCINCLECEMISKDAIDILRDIQNNLEEKDFIDRCALDMAIEALKEQRPHGKWIETDNRWGVGAWECSACTMYTIQRFDFCPHCGASMKVEGEVDDRE